MPLGEERKKLPRRTGEEEKRGIHGIDTNSHLKGQMERVLKGRKTKKERKMVTDETRTREGKAPHFEGR